MGRVLKGCLRLAVKWLQCLYELLFAGPVLLLLAVALTPEQSLWAWPAYLAGGYLCGLLLGFFLKNSRLWLRLALALATAIAPACHLFPPENGVPLLTLFGVIAVYRGSALTYASWESHYPLPLSWLGLGLYLVFSYLFTRGTLLIPYLPLYSAMGAVFLAATVFALNHRAMRQAAPSAEGRILLPRRMMKQNRLLVALILAVVLGIGLFRTIKEVVAAAAVSAARWFLECMTALYDGVGGAQPYGRNAPMLPGAGEPNPFWQAVATILMYVIAGAATLFLAAGFFAAVWAGLKAMFRAVARLLARSREPMDAAYIDKRESLWDMGRMARRAAARARRWVRSRFSPRERWADMADNRQRVRFLYRRCIRSAMASGFVPDPAATAAQTIAAAQAFCGDCALPKGLADLYGMARYGPVPPSDEDTARLRDQLQQYVPGNTSRP
jgi:hypothetical protein